MNVNLLIWREPNESGISGSYHPPCGGILLRENQSKSGSQKFSNPCISTIFVAPFNNVMPGLSQMVNFPCDKMIQG